jgi:hypothetical protein
MKKLVCLGCCAVLLIVVACVPEAGPDATKSPLAATSPLTSPLTSPPLADDVVVRYHRSGGLVASDDTWTIHSDGRVEYNGSGPGTAAQLKADQVNTLTEAIRAADFASLRESYLPDNTCCDRYVYEITSAVNGQPKTVRTIDAAPDQPPALSNLLEVLDAAVAPAK